MKGTSFIVTTLVLSRIHLGQPFFKVFVALGRFFPKDPMTSILDIAEFHLGDILFHSTSHGRRKSSVTFSSNHQSRLFNDRIKTYSIV